MFYRLKKILFFQLIFLLFFVCPVVFAQEAQYAWANPLPEEGILALLRRYHLPTSEAYLQKFKGLNSEKILNDDQLIHGDYYKLPVLIYPFNGKTIRSSIGINDYSKAKKIERYNDLLYETGLLHLPFRTSLRLWVPYFDIKNQVKKSHSIYFGRKYQNITITDYRLSGHVYYLVSGHGGPDPGAIGKRFGRRMSEDEYAYDITLRLARRLLQHDATVYMIVHDPNDGIRDEQYLKSDTDERHYGNKRIPEDRKQRLRSRSAIINSLYQKHKKLGHKQQAIIIHCDSRSLGKKIDIFFYYHKSSKTGRSLAKTLLRKIDYEYQVNQPNRNYHGVIKSRNLHMLRETHPPAVYIELGNIKNSFDQLRLVLENNRQAIANWLCEGLINAR